MMSNRMKRCKPCKIAISDMMAYRANVINFSFSRDEQCNYRDMALSRGESQSYGTVLIQFRRHIMVRRKEKKRRDEVRSNDIRCVD